MQVAVVRVDAEEVDPMLRFGDEIFVGEQVNGDADGVPGMSAGASARLDFGDVVLDTAQRCVWRNGAVVALLPSEYALLEYLALHRGEVVTRTTLYDHLFDENDDTLSNLLDVRVSNLRRKLGQNFIVTRRGHGYGIGIEA